jgi:6-phosphogluconolactonase (cycloisomerase 2 family)
MLQNNGGAPLAVASDGSFTFPASLGSGSSYAVTIQTQPNDPAQTCAVANASGSVGAANVTGVVVSCTTNAYTLSGTVSGLAGSGLLLQSGTGAQLAIDANGPFTFQGAITSGSSYAVTPTTQPQSPSQTCTVESGTGEIASANVSNVAVTCATNSFTVGGSVSGLTGGGLKLLNGSAAVEIADSGSFAFSVPVRSGLPYNVTVDVQPSNPAQRCEINNAAGIVGNANVSSVAVTCVDVYSIGGTVTGLSGAGFALRNGSDRIVINANGTFSFEQLLSAGSAYAVTVDSGPRHPVQTCSLANEQGTMGSAPVTNIAVTCETDRFAYVTSSADGHIYAFTINSTTGALTAIAESPVTSANSPNAISFEPSNRFAYVTNIDANTVTAYAADPITGVLTAIGSVATGARPVEIAIDPVGRFVYISNYGAQNVSAYSIDASTGALTSVAGSPFATGGIPRELTVHPTGKFLYVANQSNDTVLAYAIDQGTGALAALGGSPYSVGSTPFGVQMDPAGAFAYVTNGGSSNISVFESAPVTGALTPIAGSPFAATPSACSLTVDPLGRFAFVPNSAGTFGTVSVFTIAPTGALAQIADSPVAAGSSPCSAAVDPTGRFLFVANTNSSNVSGYSIDQTTGRLTPLAGSPYAVGAGSSTVVIR